MLCLANCCRNGSIKSIGFYKSLRPQKLSPVFTSVLTYAEGGFCAPPTKCPNQVSFRPYKPQCYKDHDSKNMTLKRPMSPHLTIVKMTVPATTSILQRITGVIVAVYSFFLAFGTLFLSNGVETYVSIIQSLNLGGFTILIFKLLVGLPFSFHYFNGIRFCLWNMARLMDMKEISSSAKTCVIATIVGTVLFALM